MMGHRDIVITGGRVVTGDGMTDYEKGIVRVNARGIVEVASGDAEHGPDSLVIDASGCTVLPGIINAHAHGCIRGPSMPSGSLPLPPSDTDYQRNRHLLSGTTTLLNVCGLATPDEVCGPGEERHPLDIHVTTAHTPSNLAAAMAIDGQGLTDLHKTASIDQMIDRGAKALGEAGGGQTLGGGAQDYRFVPMAISAATGVRVHPNMARKIKEAVLGRFLNATEAEGDVLDGLLVESGLSHHFNRFDICRLITETVMPAVGLSLEGFREIAEAAVRLDRPAIFHHAAPTAATLIRLAERFPKGRFIAGHSNHPSFRPEESIGFALQLRARGVLIDASTLDCIETRWRNNAANMDALVEEGLVDTVSTDFAGGDWDSILAAIHRMVRKRQLTLAAAVALGTGRVARAFPEMASDRGVLQKGLRGDITIADSHNLGRVRHVLVKGQLVVFNGALRR